MSNGLVHIEEVHVLIICQTMKAIHWMVKKIEQLKQKVNQTTYDADEKTRPTALTSPF